MTTERNVTNHREHHRPLKKLSVDEATDRELLILAEIVKSKLALLALLGELGELRRGRGFSTEAVELAIDCEQQTLAGYTRAAENRVRIVRAQPSPTSKRGQP